MIINIHRIQTTTNSTKGILDIDGDIECFTLEDTFNEPKIYGKTRIPSGEYEIKLRNEGGMNEKYKRKFGSGHIGMLHLQSVPFFKYVYLHYGNTEDDTDGCILAGSSLDINEDFMGNSVVAYRRLYEKVATALLSNEEVKIKIKDK